MVKLVLKAFFLIFFSLRKNKIKIKLKHFGLNYYLEHQTTKSLEEPKLEIDLHVGTSHL